MRQVIAVLSALLLAAFALADGIAVGLDHLAAGGIPYQSALIKWRGGEETMVVQSEIRGPAGSYAWIVPVPSKPSTIDTTNGRIFDTLYRKLTPRPFFDPNVGWPLLSLGVLLLTFGLYGIVRPERRRIPGMIVALFCSMFVVGCLLQVTAGVPRGAMGGAGSVATLASEDVGSYHVDVVRSSGPEAMLSWLKKRDGSIGPVAERAIRSYVKDGWCFTVATLKHDTVDGFLPDPLVLTFASKKPVYPMRLTGAQGGSVVVDLYVLADGTATTPLLHDVRSRPVREDELHQNMPDLYDEYDFGILAWKGSTVTRLHDSLTPSQMGDDLPLAIGPAREVGFQVMRRDDWISAVAGFVALAFGASAFVVGLIACILRWSWRAAASVALVVAIVAVGLTWNYTTSGVKPFENDLVSRDLAR